MIIRPTMPTIPVILGCLLLASPASAQPKERIAVMDLSALGVTQQEALTVSDFIRTDLVDQAAFKVIERSAMNEVSLRRGSPPQATSISLAEQLLGTMTSPSQAVSWAETVARVQEALDRMEPIDREVLALRHFEGLSNSEVAEVLGLKKSAASNRYIRALKRLKETLLSIPGFSEFANDQFS